MAVAHDAVSESHTGTTGNTSAASFSWTHTPAGTPRGVLVYTFTNANADDATSVTYGGVSMTAVPGGRAVDTAGEPGDCKAWFLGTGIPTGAQFVVVNRNNNANEMYAAGITVTAARSTQTTGVVLTQNDVAPAEQSVNDGSPGANSVRYAGLNYGGPAIPVTGANSTALIGIAFAARAIGVVRETTAGQGSRSVGFTDALDDNAGVFLAVREKPADEFAASPTALATLTANLTTRGLLRASIASVSRFTAVLNVGTDLPYSDLQDSKLFDITPDDLAVRHEMDGGYEVTRPRFAGACRRTFKTGFSSVDDTVKAAAEAHWNKMRGGWQDFGWTNPIDGLEYAVRYNKAIEFKYVGIGNTRKWNILFEFREAT